PQTMRGPGTGSNGRLRKDARHHRRSPSVSAGTPVVVGTDGGSFGRGTCSGHPARRRCHHPDTCVRGEPASGTASMQRDIVDGRRSELEEIIGAVVRLGDQRGTPTPTMDCVYASLLPQELRARGGS